ncbi:MSP domain protein [Ancylostoma caninum]|uniref:Major sperm protein n=1 Tax=Ancylostoma caninum TaxID=29170 RepID=A0A368H6T4_ANCCA|nr:MSP domain protein [Ancylostoma caninum]
MFIYAISSISAMLYDSEDHSLFLTPRVCYFSAAKGGASRHMMVNGSSQRMAIKIKCSNNEIFRVSPVYCMLEPGGSQRLQIVRDPGEAKTDKIVLLYRYTTLTNPRDVFTDLEGDDATHKKIIALVARDDIDFTLAPTTNLKSILKAYPQC